jgi:hypothetical protein
VIDARIRTIDLPGQTVTVTTEDGRDVTLAVHEGSNIEVFEPATMGMMRGTLGDLREGYWVKVAFDERAGGACRCSALVCVS